MHAKTRLPKGISSTRLTRTIGLSRGAVNHWQRGVRKPGKLAQFVLKLIEIHGLDALLSGELSANSQRNPLQSSNKRKPSKGSKAKAQ